MQLNVLNDLTEAMKALDGKKSHFTRPTGPEPCWEGRYATDKVNPCIGPRVWLIGSNHFDRPTWGAIAIDICTFSGRS